MLRRVLCLMLHAHSSGWNHSEFHIHHKRVRTDRNRKIRNRRKRETKKKVKVKRKTGELLLHFPLLCHLLSSTFPSIQTKVHMQMVICIVSFIGTHRQYFESTQKLRSVRFIWWFYLVLKFKHQQQRGWHPVKSENVKWVEASAFYVIFKSGGRGGWEVGCGRGPEGVQRPPYGFQ